MAQCGPRSCRRDRTHRRLLALDSPLPPRMITHRGGCPHLISCRGCPAVPAARGRPAPPPGVRRSRSARGPLLERVKECENPSCSLLFLDDSQARRRRWCSMGRCGNRAKIAGCRSRGRTASPS
ncbi:CGNR zinc finger domain-containing protein [Streptomyces pseudovenezuelae]|uniref:CGNR zinc finger domain-containing protein n=1 Tax=Streptomyces pseudovenezuelae TaxID=67350 RepID=UPI002E367E24|nr:CGNR zinc finger domain-containing protein [Streptomyces pseudovenezuelae]